MNLKQARQTLATAANPPWLPRTSAVPESLYIAIPVKRINPRSTIGDASGLVEGCFDRRSAGRRLHIWRMRTRRYPLNGILIEQTGTNVVAVAIRPGRPVSQIGPPELSLPAPLLDRCPGRPLAWLS